MKRCVATVIAIAATLGPCGPALSDEAEIIAELQRQIVPCWTMPADVNKWTTPVTLTFKLDRRGEVIGVPLIVRNPEIREYGKHFVASATRAIRACAPYRLPAEDYEIWKEVKITFRAPGT